MKYIWQYKSWPKLTWDSAPLISLIGTARFEQGKLLEKVGRLGFKLSREAQADILIEETIKTAAIEGESLNRESVRSSVASHLGFPTAGMPRPNRSDDGLVEVLLDATQHYDKPLTSVRLKRWQAALFPTGQSALKPIRTGKWRHVNEPMRVVSGAVGKEKVHYEAPLGKNVEQEVKQFLIWWKTQSEKTDGLLRSGLAHFYFVTIHPFEDGNGRIARALTEMALAQDEKLSTRFYSLSSQIMEEREAYYNVLEKTQKGSGDVTEWLEWYLGCYSRSLVKSEKLIANVLAKAEFWQRHSQKEINQRQRKVLNKLLAAGKKGFKGGLTTRKYVSMAKVSRATAFREISELIKMGFLKKNLPQGRSVSYDLSWQ